MVKQFVTLVVILFSLLILLQSVQGVPSPANTTWIRDYGSANVSASDSDTTEGGNITFLNLDVGQPTDRWAGYVGNVSGGITLSDGSSVFFRWDTTTADGSVCAGIATNYNWSALFALSDVDQMDQAWGFAGGTDLTISTFNYTPSDTCGDIGINDLSGVNTSKTGPDNPANDLFETCVINDQNATSNVSQDMIFCVETDRTGATNDYRSSGDSDYELIVPVAEGSTETFYFFLEL